MSCNGLEFRIIFASNIDFNIKHEMTAGVIDYSLKK